MMIVAEQLFLFLSCPFPCLKNPPCVQLGTNLFREEPLPYLVYQPLPWQIQCVSQSRRTSRDSEVRAAGSACCRGTCEPGSLEV